MKGGVIVGFLEKINNWLDEVPPSAAERIVEYKAKQEAMDKTPTFEGYLKAQGPIGLLTVILRHDEVKRIDG